MIVSICTNCTNQHVYALSHCFVAKTYLFRIVAMMVWRHHSKHFEPVWILWRQVYKNRIVCSFYFIDYYIINEDRDRDWLWRPLLESSKGTSWCSWWCCRGEGDAHHWNDVADRHGGAASCSSSSSFRRCCVVAVAATTANTFFIHSRQKAGSGPQRRGRCGEHNLYDSISCWRPIVGCITLPYTSRSTLRRKSSSVRCVRWLIVCTLAMDTMCLQQTVTGASTWDVSTCPIVWRVSMCVLHAAGSVFASTSGQISWSWCPLFMSVICIWLPHNLAICRVICQEQWQ